MLIPAFMQICKTIMYWAQYNNRNCNLICTLKHGVVAEFSFFCEKLPNIFPHYILCLYFWQNDTIWFLANLITIHHDQNPYFGNNLIDLDDGERWNIDDNTHNEVTFYKKTTIKSLFIYFALLKTTTVFSWRYLNWAS